MNINSEYLPAVEMEKCCDDHDMCYDTCLADKELCDLDFKRCLYKYCDNYEKSLGGDIVVKGCKAAAKLLFTGTVTLGCKPYLDAQANACYCTATGGANGKYANGKQGEAAGNGKKYDKKQQGKEKEKPPNYGWKNDL
jgi:secretory phospholipase A2